MILKSKNLNSQTTSGFLWVIIFNNVYDEEKCLNHLFRDIDIIIPGSHLYNPLIGTKGTLFCTVLYVDTRHCSNYNQSVFYKGKFSDAYLHIGKARHWLQFWIISATLATLSYIFFTLFQEITWDFTGQAFLEKLAKQFEQTGQSMEQTLPKGFTPQSMLLLYVIGNFTIFNVLPGLITGMGEELGHRGIMFKWLAEKNVKTAILLGGVFWFLWHLPLGLIMPMKHNYTTAEIVLNVLIQTIGSICTHIYLAFILLKTRSIWITALSHITFNNVSTALGFFVIVQNQTLANLGLVLTMVLTVIVGFWKFNFGNVLKNQDP